jgi:hypothetical protein
LPRADSALPQQQVWEKLVFLSRTYSCDSAAQWFQQVIADVAREVVAQIDVWGDYQWHSRGLDVFATVKRRCIDHHVKQRAIIVAIRDGSSATSGIAVQALPGIDQAQGLRLGPHRYANIHVLPCN